MNFQKLIGGLVEGDAAAANFAAAHLALQFKIPVLGKIFGLRQAFLLGASAVIAPFQEGRALPEMGVFRL